MPPAVHLRPDRLRAHAAEATALSDVLRGAQKGRPSAAHPGLDVVDTGLHRAVRELTELAAVLIAAAHAAETADVDAARALRQAGARS